MIVTSDTIVDYFEKINWSHEVLSPTHVLTTYRCPVSAYYYVINIEVVISEHWVLLRALLHQNISQEHMRPVLQLISAWNQHSYTVRFLLVDRCVVLQAEVPIVQLDEGSFIGSLAAVCRYGRLAGVVIATLATNPSLVTQFDAITTDSWSPEWDDAVQPDELDLEYDISMNRLPD